MDAVPQE
jgi:hypothetical protein